jgi:predicted nucleotidyltransferase
MHKKFHQKMDRFHYGVEIMAQRTPPKPVLDYIAQLRRTYPDLRKVYIFGSFVQDKARKDSDIDLAMVFDDVPDNFDRQVQLMKFRRQFDSRIEPHVFRVADFDTSNPLAGEIMKSGIEVNE